MMINSRNMFCGMAIFGMLAFAASYPLEPLFFSNQNTYLLHAVAALHPSRLGGDWFAGTADPVPLFTHLLRLVMDVGGDAGVYFLTECFFLVYFASLLSIALKGAGAKLAAPATPWIILVLVALHSTLLSSVLRSAGLKADPMTGLADQYVLGGALQPSMCGVFLLASIALFQRERYVLAAVAAGLAPLLHPTYLLAAAFLAAGYALATLKFRPQHWKMLLLAAAICGALLLATVVMVLNSMGKSPSAQILAEAQGILVEKRIPQHAKPSVWGPHLSTVVMILAVAAASLLARDPATRAILAVSGALAGLLSAAAALAGSHALDLLFPWRISVVLVPASVSILAARVLVAVADRWKAPGWAAPAAAAAGLALLAAAGLRHTRHDFLHRGAEAQAVAAGAVLKIAQPGEIFLVPPHWDNFRIAAMAPIVVDWKSNPYRPEDVLEWYRRYTEVNALYQQDAADCAAWLATMQRYQAHAVVTRKGLLDGCAPVSAAATAGDYSIYRLPPG